jgi:CheY-like chemotaxis protein
MQLSKDYDAASGQGESSSSFGNAASRPVLESVADAPPPPARLLLVDDTPANLKILARVLEKRGYQTELAEDGHQAVERFRTRNYDAILMDLQMPGLDGFGATAAIRAMSDRRQVPIIALTAHVIDGTRERCLAVGMSDYLAKPIDVALLTATIESQLRASH